jgi:hypothetical protein
VRRDFVCGLALQLGSNGGTQIHEILNPLKTDVGQCTEERRKRPTGPDRPRPLRYFYREKKQVVAPFSHVPLFTLKLWKPMVSFKIFRDYFWMGLLLSEIVRYEQAFIFHHFVMPVHHNQCSSRNASCGCPVMPDFSRHTIPPSCSSNCPVMPGFSHHTIPPSNSSSSNCCLFGCPAMPVYSCSCMHPAACQASMYPWQTHCCQAAWATHHHQHVPLRSGPCCFQDLQATSGCTQTVGLQATSGCTQTVDLQTTSACTQTVTVVSRETQTDWYDPDETIDAVQEHYTQDPDETTNSGGFSPILLHCSGARLSSPVLLAQHNGDQPPSPIHINTLGLCKDANTALCSLLLSPPGSPSPKQVSSWHSDSATFYNTPTRASQGDFSMANGVDPLGLVSLSPLMSSRGSGPMPTSVHGSPEATSSKPPPPTLNPGNVANVLSELVSLSLNSAATGSSLAAASPSHLLLPSNFVYDLPAMQSTNMMHLVRQNPPLLHFWAGNMLEGVPQGRRDCLDLAGKLPLCLRALKIGIDPSSLMVDAAQAGGVYGGGDGCILGPGGTLETIEIKGCICRRGKRKAFSFRNIRCAGADWRHLFLLGRLRNPTSWERSSDVEGCMWLGYVGRDAYERALGASGRPLDKPMLAAVSPGSQKSWLGGQVAWVKLGELSLAWWQQHVLGR